MSLITYGIYLLWDHLCAFYEVYKPQVDKLREKKKIRCQAVNQNDEKEDELENNDENENIQSQSVPIQQNKVTKPKRGPKPKI